MFLPSPWTSEQRLIIFLLLKSFFVYEFGFALEVAQFFDLPHPLFVKLFAALNADHAAAMFALEAVVLLLEAGSHLVAANVNFGVAFAAAAVCADAACAFGYFDKVVVFELGMDAVGGAEFAVVDVLVHFLLLAAGDADEVTVAFGGGVELVADVGHFVVAGEVGGEVGHCQSLRHGVQFGQLQLVYFFDGHPSHSDPVGVRFIVLFDVDGVVFIVKANDISSQHLVLPA